VRYDPIDSVSHPILNFLPRTTRGRNGSDNSRERTVQDLIQFVSFKTRLGGGQGGGEFNDYTARYYSIREEDKLTVREYLLKQQSIHGSNNNDDDVDDNDDMLCKFSKLLKLNDLLDLPLITLSNGQTRRFRILSSLLRKPLLLILEEPFTGLDVESRQSLIELLENLHSNESPRVLLVLRPQDSLPRFVTHLALVQGATVKLGTKQDILATDQAKLWFEKGKLETNALQQRRQLQRQRQTQRQLEEPSSSKLIELENVNVVYGREEEGEKRRVLNDISWTVRRGEKWVLAGHNGSGKSTLLSIILGDHPRSFTENVTLFGNPRYKQATSTIQSMIGHVSPEIYNSFPRKHDPTQGLTIYDCLVSGFESIYSYRRPTDSQRIMIDSLLTSFSRHPLLTNRESLESRLFATLNPGEQSLILLLRALVKRPKLLVLDEPFQGMDRETIDLVNNYLEFELDKEDETSVILISHFEEEIPEFFDRRLELKNGAIEEII
jgi:ABC-type molybdenum transport system ATPase subunit/photorepair protein PhrA